MKKYWVLGLLCMVPDWTGANAALAGTAVVMQPVSATGSHTIIGTDIFLPAGPQRVGFEIRVAGWGASELITVQVRLDASGFDNGTTPLEIANVPCPSNNSTGHNFCAQTLQTGSRCSRGCPGGSSVGCHCDWGFQNITRPDFVAFGFSHISAVDVSTLNARFGTTLNDFGFISDPAGASLYLGTFYLDVPASAQGVYDIGIVEEGETFLQDSGMVPDNYIPIDLFAAARIIIGDPVVPGSRYVTFQPGDPGQQTAVRVTMTSAYHPRPPVADGEDRDLSALDEQVRWLGPPAVFSDNAPESTFKAAPLQCTPHFADWGSMGTIQVYGDVIIPSSVYSIHQVPISCQNDPNNPSCFGPAQVVHTGQWGDAATPYARSDQPAQPDAADLAVMVDAFRELVGAASKSRTHLRGVVPDPATATNFLDVFFAVDAVRGMPFPHPVPSSCP